MEPLIWVKTEEKWAYILMIRGQTVYRIKVTGNILTLKKKLAAVLEALQQGEDPIALKVKSIVTMDARTIARALVSPDKGSLRLQGDEEGAKEVKFSTADDNADEILDQVLRRAGRNFVATEEEIGVVEAVLPPTFVGFFGGLICLGLYDAAAKLARNEEIVVKVTRRRGLHHTLNIVAELLGLYGTLALTALFTGWILYWLISRIFQRPRRTVWLPATT